MLRSARFWRVRGVMANTWYGQSQPQPQVLGWAGWLRVLARGAVLLVLVGAGMLILLALRLIERPVFGQRRPLSPAVTQIVCRAALGVIGLGYERRGVPLRHGGAVVANHVSWLDIFTLNAGQRVYFVAKAEVARWPLIGALARVTGTVFITRQRQAAAAQVALFRHRLQAGHQLLFFPEGTSTDGAQVLPFKPTLFAAFFDQGLPEDFQLQAVSVIYQAPQGADARLYGWWGDMDFAAHLVATLAVRRQGAVRVIYHPPLTLAAYACRKDLARALEAQVRAGVAQGGL